jgi:hypothetical protein
MISACMCGTTYTPYAILNTLQFIVLLWLGNSRVAIGGFRVHENHFSVIMGAFQTLNANPWIKILCTAALNMICSVTNSNWLAIMSPTLHVKPTLFAIPCKFLGDTDLQCCNFYHWPIDLSSKFQSSMTIPDHKLLTREGSVWANVWTHPSSMTILVNLFIRSVIWKVTFNDIKCHMALDIMFSVVRWLPHPIITCHHKRKMTA